ncbi:MAG: adenylate/guanylate cyclase domain-containing protein [Candidatus Kapaibacterium sp.]|nr:MAG: adenylate/guanylate cyclase domain-containing protein [Candidatus Kapabacteria bacterium]
MQRPFFLVPFLAHLRRSLTQLGVFSEHTATLSPEVEQRIALEILKIQQLRVMILICLGTVATTQAFATEFLLPPSTRALRGVFQNFSLVEWGCIMMSATLYEVGAFMLAYKAIRTRTVPPVWMQYLSLIVEMSFPTLVILFQGPLIHPLFAVHTPFILTYSLFIVLSVLRLSFRFSLVSGIAAGIGYFLVYWLITPQPRPITAENYFYASPTIALAKSWFLVISGAVAGFVGYQMRKVLAFAIHLQEERNNVVGMFGQYVSPSVVEKLMESQKNLENDLAGEVRQVTVLFLDIRGFTTFSEHRTPTEVVQYLNTLFGHLISTVNAHDGIVNKFLGDGFMAVFGAPFSTGMDSANAFRAALEMTAKVEDLNRSQTIPETRIGIGIHTGIAVTGSVGSEERKEYTIIGDTVNLAARVEQLTKEYAAQMLITEAVFEKLRIEMSQHEHTEKCHFEELPPVHVKGRNEPVVIYKAT